MTPSTPNQNQNNGAECGADPSQDVFHVVANLWCFIDWKALRGVVRFADSSNFFAEAEKETKRRQAEMCANQVWIAPLQRPICQPVLHHHLMACVHVQTFYGLMNLEPILMAFHAPIVYPVHVIDDPLFTNLVVKLILNEHQMRVNGFPVIQGRTLRLQPNEYQKDRMMFVPSCDLPRKCIRCFQEFLVDGNGCQVVGPNTKCKDGESVHQCHITDQMPIEKLYQFETAVERNSMLPGGRVLSIDCEMVYTVKGQSIGRVAMVDSRGNVIIDAIVQPEHRIIDCVTKFSGLTPNNFQYATETLQSIRAKILSEMDSTTILVGHGLYGDLKVLGIAHNRVVDTSIIYTHRGRRPALRHLAETHLGYKIQNGGHCCKEDAVAAAHLVHFGVNNPKFLAPGFKQFFRC